MKDVSYIRVNKAIFAAGAKIQKLDLSDMDNFFLKKEEIILSEMEGLGIKKGEPMFSLVRAEFYRLLKFCPDS